MQSIATLLQQEFEKTSSSPERVFYYRGGADKASYVTSWSPITRRADSITSGNVSLEISNTDQSWNDILVSPGTHINPGATNTTIQVGYTGIGFMSVFQGKLLSANFSSVDSLSLTFRDKISYFTQVPIGSDESPADYYSSSSYTVFTDSDWSTGRNPAHLIWHLLTNWGGLDNTEGAGNTDIDWSKFTEFRDILDSLGLKIQAKFQGETLTNALKEIADITLSTVFSEADGKIICRYWLGQDNTSVQSYNSTKWKNLPSVIMDRFDIINRYLVYYGLSFPVQDSGTATSGADTTLTDTGKAWSTNAYKNMYLHITGGTGAGQTRSIVSNTATVITVSLDWDTNPDNTSTYEILDYTAGAFLGSILREDATSKSVYGTLERIYDGTIIWYYRSPSAIEFAERMLIDTKDPIQYAEIECGLLAYRQQLWDALKLTESFYSWVDQGFRIEELSFNTNEGTVRINGRLTTLYPFLILDDATFGKIDSTNVLA
jgi:hypothetical protein